MNNVVLALTRIIQAVSQSNSDSDQVSIIVESICKTMEVDVCSLYMADEHSNMVLVASHGLETAAVGQVTLQPGKGLVGLVVESRHPINVADAQHHPAYRYVAETREESFRSFCGVPLVYSGKVIGVLVVQGRAARLLSDQEEAFLVTLAAQLALLKVSQPLSGGPAALVNLRLKGVQGAPGVGLGQVQLCTSGDLYAVSNKPCDNIETALQEWRQLLAEVRGSIDIERKALQGEVSESIAGIFAAYQMLLADPALTEGVEQGIRNGNWLPGALRQVIQHFSDLFQAIEDPYLKARHEDIHHLGNKLYNAWRGIEEPQALSLGPVILVGPQVSVSEIAAVPTGALAGIVCFEGSSLSHTAVLANAMGIPAVMGTGNIKGIQSGQTLIVDGNQSQVILHPSEALLQEFQKLIAEDQQLLEQLKKLRDEPVVTTDGERLRLYTNTGLLADITPGLANGAQGVGLYRTEIPFMVHDSFPSEEEQVQVYREVLNAYAGKPVYMRILDIGGDKPLPYFSVTEENPALGWRGIRFCLDNSPLLMTQIRAMIRAAAGADNLHILLPMVSATAELNAFRELLDDACRQLRDEGVPLQKPKVGIMVEVPAAISQLPFWSEKIDFISIGSNDLSQYLLALDRNNARVSSRYDHIHPAVLHEIRRVVDCARSLGLPVSLCGEMASDPVAVILLVGMGIRTLSMSAAKLPRIKWLIRTISVGRAKVLAAQALRMDNAAAIRELVRTEILGLGLKALV